MERMGPRRAAQENGDGTTAGRVGVVRATAVTVAVVAALAGCSVTVKPKNAAASSPLSSTPTPSAVSSSTTLSTAAPSSTSAAPSTPAPSDVDHTVCGNVRDVLATLKDKLATDKDSTSRSSLDYRNAGTALRTQDAKTDNADLKATLKTVGTDYQTVGHDIANHESSDADLGKALDASKPLATLCGGGGSSAGGSSTATSTATTSSSSG
ncbi:hypothetical protein ABH926_001003 [Catenulispora sp. GP43]|uniref:hypothetical protein n=1 Tax=Catenulispora sp. GP43 TaxID=3156263 RepID=UPI0035138CA4